MLDFKVGKTYKDFLGKEWEFCSYCSIENYPYRFKDKYGDIKSFKEYTDTVVTEWEDGTGIRIPFVEEEEKEREWKIGESYECYDVHFEKITKAKLAHVENHKNTLIYRFELGKKWMFFCGTGEILSIDGYVIFKNGIPEELRKRIEKEKLTNKRKCFQKGQVYKTNTGKEYIFKRRIKTKNSLFVIFEDDKGWVCIDKLFRLNNIECVPFCASNGMFLCADESIRNENTNKAVRIME